MSGVGDCEKCEELLQGFLDRELTEAQHAEAESHLNGCDYCRRRYKFEATLRQYVRVSAVERMPQGLMERLGQLRGGDAAL